MFMSNNGFNEVDKFSDKWVINLSNVHLNSAEMSVLKLDPKFQITPNTLNLEKIITSVESKLIFSNKNRTEIARIRNSLT